MRFDPAVARRNMVLCQLQPSDVTDEAVIAAMSEVPRERFVAPELASLAYTDEDVAIAPKRALLAPMVFARLVQAIGVKAGERALDVGAATGYGAAILRRLGARPVALECEPELAIAARGLLGSLGVDAEVVQGPLDRGDPEHAPFDVILFEGAIEEMPGGLLAQLADGGRAAAVVGARGRTRAVLYRRNKDEITERVLFDAAASALPGFAKAARFVF